mmetsp:Transcript_18981/g.28119  ORF Transcript_18981/g.28119 Transcript_18981/m.28119 type:complete len:369 (-) Transcript_18981:120-1226(-)
MWGYLVTALLAASAQLYMTKRARPESIKFRGGAQYPSIPKYTSDILSEAEHEAFKRDGFIIKKGLLKGKELTEVIDAGEIYYKAKLTSLQKIFSSSFAKLGFDVWRVNEKFTQVAMESAFPGIAAELMGMDSRTEEEKSVRILRDGFFGLKNKNNTGCGFHVDDPGFWPATEDSTGVNFWLALSPIRIAEGGGIRVVNQTLSRPFFDECKAVIQRMGPYGPSTCFMESLSPECHQKMMESSMVFDMEPGDALIWDRWTFHRSEPFRNDANNAPDEEEEIYKLRYTIRYVPGSALASGMVHKSQEQGLPFDGPYYPKVWPDFVKEEIDSIRNGLGPDMDFSFSKILKQSQEKIAKKIGDGFRILVPKKV